MSTYLLLYSGGRLPQTEEETKTVMEAWGAWLAGIGDALVDGNPFTPNAKTLSPDGDVSDGPVGPMASGYSLIKAGSMDETVEMAKGCPREAQRCEHLDLRGDVALPLKVTPACADVLLPGGPPNGAARGRDHPRAHLPHHLGRRTTFLCA